MMYDTLDYMIGNTIGFLAILGVIALACAVVLQAPIPGRLRALIVLALVLRVVGAVVRFVVLHWVYHGVGDASGYFRVGAYYAEFFQNFDFTPIVDSTMWWDGRWWGSSIVRWASGFVLTFIGPSMLGEFIVFSVLSFLGLVAFVVAFKRAFPSLPVARYARWVWLFPSLWYWPASVGKEALCLLGIGLATWGVIGRGSRLSWLPLAAGTGLIVVIRPELAMVFLAAAIIAYWLGSGEQWTVGKTYQAVAIAAVSILVMTMGLRAVGVGSFDVEGVQEYIELEPARAIGGGSAIGAPPVGVLGVPRALMNVLMRPFPWEGASAATLLAAVEVAALWAFALLRRRQLVAALRGWRRSRLLCLSLAFVLLYAAALGMMVGNLGILARQRIFLFPFLFVFFEAVPAASVAGRRRLRRALAPFSARSPAA
jgi:hypothetical protein